MNKDDLCHKFTNTMGHETKFFTYPIDKVEQYTSGYMYELY
ncbi:MAG: hypothetical protein Q8899_01865 [Weeping tea tree witches'-broom phytoplasma]|nr:hypothetical protein [Weeping tea tree witches'-broom phytoplasma]